MNYNNDHLYNLFYVLLQWININQYGLYSLIFILIKSKNKIFVKFIIIISIAIVSWGEGFIFKKKSDLELHYQAVWL